MNAGRLAPSPTGAQHLGNARTYLLAYWSARKLGQRLILRIEDVDSPRIKHWAIDQAIDDLRWLGIDWDEGPDIGGPHAPYIQTQRTERYHQALQRLIEDNRVFPCTCTRKDIELAGSAPHFEHEGKVYPGTCARWNPCDSIPDPGTFCWRFRCGSEPVSFEDHVHGRQSCVPADAIGAFPVTQKNGAPAYQLAVVVDDGQMGITHVVRGDDLIASTFRQIELANALELPTPEYAHVPLVCGDDGRRLAKRHGDTRLSLFREQGMNPARIITWAARSAGLLEPRESVDSAAEVVERFQWDRVPRVKVMLDGEYWGTQRR